MYLVKSMKLLKEFKKFGGVSTPKHIKKTYLLIGQLKTELHKILEFEITKSMDTFSLRITHH